MKMTLIGAALAVALAAPAALACTAAEVQQKVTKFSQKYQEVAQKSPDKLQKFAPKVQEATQKYQQAVGAGTPNYAEVCKLYDELNAELDKL